MKREIIEIDESKCTGCGLCVPGCPEGALQIIDGKARLVSDLLCDGLGACIGDCPEGAISVTEREAEAYDERKVMLDNIVPKGTNTIKAHLKHLKDHNQDEYYQQAVAVLTEQGIAVPVLEEAQGCGSGHGGGGCPGTQSQSFDKTSPSAASSAGVRPSTLTHWPVQMHLINPRAPHYQGADMLLAADCSAFAMGDFHKDWLKGKVLAIACPKLDEGQDVYLEKIKSLIEDAKINTLTVMVMTVPCCGGLVRMVQRAIAETSRKVPVKVVVVGLQGEIAKEEWI